MATFEAGLWRRSTGPLRLLVLAVALWAAGCGAEPPTPDLLRVVDVVPRDVDLGDKIEVLGVHLPSSESQTAEVRFRGTLRRAGRPALREQEIVVEAAALSVSGVRVPLDEALLERFCGRGDAAQHTTFLGNVTVAIPGTPVHGTVHGVSLDLRPPPPRRGILEAREAEARRALEFLGIRVESQAVGPLGALVQDVRPGSPAARAGLQSADLLLSFDGLTLRALEDFVPSGEGRKVSLSVRRGEEAPLQLSLPLEGYRSSAPRDLLWAQVLLGTLGALLLFQLSPLAAWLIWIERRVLVRTRAELGPVGRAAGSPPAIVTRLGRIARDQLSLPARHGEGRSLAPALTFVGVSSLLSATPFARRWLGADLDVGQLLLVTTTALVTMAFLLGGRDALLVATLRGRLRAAAQVLGYSVPLLLTVAGVVLTVGTLRLGDLVHAQSGTSGVWLERGAWPWTWQLFQNPIGLGLGLVFLTAVWFAGAKPPSAALGQRQPGALFFVAEWAQVLLLCGVGSALFLGGWQLPGLTPAEQQARGLWQVVGVLFFLGKAWGLAMAVLWSRWALPRPRPEELSRTLWRGLAPASVVGVGLAALMTRLSLTPVGALSLGLVTLLACTALGLAFTMRLLRGLRARRLERVHLSPSL